jgi:hypothetical protein
MLPLIGANRGNDVVWLCHCNGASLLVSLSRLAGGRSATGVERKGRMAPFHGLLCLVQGFFALLRAFAGV